MDFVLNKFQINNVYILQYSTVKKLSFSIFRKSIANYSNTSRLQHSDDIVDHLIVNSQAKN